MKNCKGQNVIEYVLLLTAVAVVCIYFLVGQSPMKQSVNASLNSMINQINSATASIQLQ